jgi:DNA repair protein RecN (Recombination protein N)
MLKTLQIKDYALIDGIEIEFGKGLNIITGETGAGKSILIDAMGLLLGERASTEVVRKGASKSVVEGIFDVSNNKKVKKLLTENDIEFFDELILRREVSLKGSNRCFINDTPVNLNLIKDAGNLLVDLHGQHEHQSLLRTETHIDFLDEFGGIERPLETYRKYFSELNDKLAELRSVSSKEHLLKEKKDLYLFQLREIDQVSPLDNEDAKLSGELKILENSEKLLELASDIYNKLYEDENSALDVFTSAGNEIKELAKIDGSLEDVYADYESAKNIISEIASTVRRYKDNLEIDPEKIEEIRTRLSSISMLKKKYGGAVKAIIEYREKISAELELAENFQEHIEKLEAEIKNLRERCGNEAFNISEIRKKTAQKICREVEASLRFLGIENSVFRVNIANMEAENATGQYITLKGKNFRCSSKGFDEVEFYISTNLGEDAKPLVKVASGGEVSRIMLALKSTLAKNDKLPLLIFDEIDTGVSGRIARKVGQALKSLADIHQIIAITHLPQIAGLGDFHFAVEKKITDGRVISSIRSLEREERIKEVAKLMSGEEITETSLNTARELMGL